MESFAEYHYGLRGNYESLGNLEQKLTSVKNLSWALFPKFDIILKDKNENSYLLHLTHDLYDKNPRAVLAALVDRQDDMEMFPMQDYLGMEAAVESALDAFVPRKIKTNLFKNNELYTSYSLEAPVLPVHLPKAIGDLKKSVKVDGIRGYIMSKDPGTIQEIRQWWHNQPLEGGEEK